MPPPFRLGLAGLLFASYLLVPPSVRSRSNRSCRSPKRGSATDPTTPAGSENGETRQLTSGGGGVEPSQRTDEYRRIPELIRSSVRPEFPEPNEDRR